MAPPLDDASREYRSLYVAEPQLTALREVLADYRPNATHIADYVQTLGEEARGDLPGQPARSSARRSS